MERDKSLVLPARCANHPFRRAPTPSREAARPRYSWGRSRRAPWMWAVCFAKRRSALGAAAGIGGTAVAWTRAEVAAWGLLAVVVSMVVGASQEMSASRNKQASTSLSWTLHVRRRRHRRRVPMGRLFYDFSLRNSLNLRGRKHPGRYTPHVVCASSGGFKAESHPSIQTS